MKTEFSTPDLQELLSYLKMYFSNSDSLSVYRDIHEHTDVQGNFAGDDHVFSIFDKLSSDFYFVVSPYDEKSKRAAQHALVFSGGTLKKQFDFTDYANMRTGAMDTLLLQALGVEALRAKVLLFGTGGIARWSVRFLKAQYPDLSQIEYINRTVTPDADFEAFGKEHGVTLKVTDKSQLREYGYIFCHTSASSPVLLSEDESSLRKDVVITSYLTSNTFEEIQDSYWDTTKNTVVLSWDKEISNSKDLQRAQKSMILDPLRTVTLTDLLKSNTKTLDGRIVFRSAGTPIQNAALIKYLTQRN